MINKISSFFSSQINQIRPYLTPRVGLVSFVALGALSTLAFFFLRRKPTIPQSRINSNPPFPPALKPSAKDPSLSGNSSQVLSPSSKPTAQQASLNPLPEPVEAPVSKPAAPSNLAPLDPQSEPVSPPVSKPTAHSNLPPSDPKPEPLPNPLPSAPLLTPQTLRVEPHMLEDSNFAHNVQTIIDFPEDGSAQIKSFQGKLARGDGFLRYYNAIAGTQLPETLGVIAKTFLGVHFAFDNTYKAIVEKPNIEEKKPHLRLLSDILTQEMNLLKGLDHIRQVYSERYQDIPTKEGIGSLSSLFETRKSLIEEHYQKYKDLIQSLQSQMQAFKGPHASLTRSIIEPRLKSALTTEDAAHSLSSYCAMYCPGIPSYKAAEMIQKGQLLMRGILKGDCEPSKDRTQSQLELAQITWFLKYCAIQKKQGAHEWSLAIEESSKLYKFLVASPGSYERASSHYIGRSPVNNGYSSYLMKSSLHHGVDIMNGEMPAEKRTILFELVERFNSPDKLLFFKPENFGTAEWFDLVNHGGELVESVQKKARAQGEDDLPGMQKERVPDDLKKAFISLLKHMQEKLAVYQPTLQKLAAENPGVYDLKKSMDQAKLWGISYMHAFLKGLKNIPDAPRQLKPYLDAVENTWKSLDHLEKRTGKEIYLSAEELADFTTQELKL